MLLALGFVLLLPAFSSAEAPGLILRRGADQAARQPNRPRHDQPPQLAAVAPRRPAVRPAADDGFVLVLLVLTLNSAVVIIKVASSLPSWINN